MAQTVGDIAHARVEKNQVHFEAGRVTVCCRVGRHRFEGLWKDDSCIPKRFFSFYPDDRIQAVVVEIFEIIEVRSVAVKGREFYIQTMILRQ